MLGECAVRFGEEPLNGGRGRGLAVSSEGKRALFGS